MQKIWTRIASPWLALALCACSVDADQDGWPASQDCDDDAAGVSPVATELCDDVDNDCDGFIDEHVGQWYYEDRDRDGFGGGVANYLCPAQVLDTPALEYVDNALDCDDQRADVYPGAPVSCDEADVDANCDGVVDAEDGDGDGFSACRGDCAESAPEVYPGAPVICGDHRVNDCEMTANEEARLCRVEETEDLYFLSPRVLGDQVGLLIGQAVRGVGDFDGDGVDDFAIMSGPLPGEEEHLGAYLFTSFPQGDVLTTQAESIVVGIASGECLGGDVVGADFTRDGRSDIVFGGCASEEVPGEAWVVFADQLPDALQNGGPESVSRVSDLRFVGPAPGDMGLRWLAVGQDLDGGGVSELLLASPQHEDRGRVWAFLGERIADGELYGRVELVEWELGDPGAADLVLTGPEGSAFGDAITFAEDTNGDGRPELVVGAPGTRALNASGDSVPAGAVHLMGWDSRLPRGSQLDVGDMDAAVYGEPVEGQAGLSVSGAGDVDGDGYNELLIGAPSYDGSEGAAYIVWGPVDGARQLPESATRITGRHSGDLLGHRVVGPGDMDGDGLGEVAVSGSGTWGRSGEVLIWYGDAALRDRSELRPSEADRRYIGAGSWDWTGARMAAAGDVNADGYPDLIVSAQGNDASADSAGAVYLLLGGGL